MITMGGRPRLMIFSYLAGRLPRIIMTLKACHDTRHGGHPVADRRFDGFDVCF